MRANSEWQIHFQSAVEALAPSGSSVVRRFWVLFVGGQSLGEGAWFWMHSFRQLYILHLLVLSGSQVESLSRLLRAGFSRLSDFKGHGPGLARQRSESLRWLLSIVLVGFAYATGWSAPISRATLLSVLGLWFARISSMWLLPMAFVLQWVLFPDHRVEMGFYLSWIAYLVVVAMGEIRISKFLATILVSGLLFVIVDVGHFGNPFQMRSFVLCLASNLFFCTFFDLVLMPVGAALIFACLGLTLVKVLGFEVDVGGDFLALWTRPLGEALLVVLNWLMYT